MADLATPPAHQVNNAGNGLNWVDFHSAIAQFRTIRKSWLTSSSASSVMSSY